MVQTLGVGSGGISRRKQENDPAQEKCYDAEEREWLDG